MKQSDRKKLVEAMNKVESTGFEQAVASIIYSIHGLDAALKYVREAPNHRESDEIDRKE
jgi:hypothetical protein